MTSNPRIIIPKIIFGVTVEGAILTCNVPNDSSFQ